MIAVSSLLCPGDFVTFLAETNQFETSAPTSTIDRSESWRDRWAHVTRPGAGRFDRTLGARPVDNSYRCAAGFIAAAQIARVAAKHLLLRATSDCPGCILASSMVCRR